MQSPIFLINKRYNSLRKSEKRVAEFVQEHMDEVVLLSLQGLAEKCSTSDATVLRFCRSLGYLGLADFKTSLVPELLRSGQQVYMDIEQNQDSESIKEIFYRNINQQLDSTLRNCDFEVFHLVARKLIEANRILIIGLGGSAGVAQIFCDALGSLGIFSNYLHDRSLIQNLVPTLVNGDVIVGISHSGETDEIISAVKKAHEFGATTISMTNFSPSPLTDVSHFVLLTSVPNNLLGSFSCQARIFQLALLELVLNEISRQFVEKSSGEYSQ
jgi:RpiR family carbohydrate utilization transcriptional regulator